MAVNSRGRTTEALLPQKWKERETSPERTKVWVEPSSSKLKAAERKVPVVYYLCRNGQLEQPHFMEVPLSSPEGLYLRDVINRLNFLRGKGMASMYSWSSKRGYKNGFVWHDLSESDFIYPASGKEYVLKGSELLEGASLISKSDESFSSSFRRPPPETRPSGDDSDFPAAVTRRRNQSWSAIDLHEYQVYKAESPGESSAAADASTQTDDKRRRRRPIIETEDEEREHKKEEESTELSREEISPPPSDSSPETLETLMKADGRLVLCPPGEIGADRTTDNHHPSGRHRASSVLMQLISCGSISFRDCGATSAKDPRFSLISHYKGRVPRGGGGRDQVGKGAEEGNVENPRFQEVIGRGNNNGKSKMEDKEYFSGSLVETKKEEFPSLKRSSSYNADRTSHLELTDKGTEGMRARCIPRKPKTPTN
ncbi:protein SOSEKI 5 [Rhododendron vialii]|uniref:protein SOSEKI 5 n=1 Tax=Rhododendron vialii TaxID=182163 RepID=UPI00265E1EB7|nr:protein SOSEKI 5 [Rhododendron vialii]